VSYVCPLGVCVCVCVCVCVVYVSLIERGILYPHLTEGIVGKQKRKPGISSWQMHGENYAERRILSVPFRRDLPHR
jgi:hypothetical protein